MTASEPPRFQAKCIKISAVVTRSGTDSTSPIVAIFGRNFSQDKHLAKCSEIFEKKGFHTIRISSTFVNTVLRMNRTKTISLKFLEILEEMNSNQNRPIILYTMSMGGFMMYHLINEAILTPGQQDYNSIHVAGCIFDSCPTFLNFNILKEQLKVLNTIQNSLSKVLLQLGWIVVYPVFLLSPVVRGQILQDSMASPLGCPELILVQ